MLNQTASSSGAFVVGDQKVCIVPVEYSKRFSKLFGTPTTAQKFSPKKTEFIRFKLIS